MGWKPQGLWYRGAADSNRRMKLRAYIYSLYGFSFRSARRAVRRVRAALGCSRQGTFTEDGYLIASTTALREALSALPQGQSVVVPTSPLLWVFSSPFLSWGVALIGFAGIVILRKIAPPAGQGQWVL
jgi:hypothetical protein